MTTRKKSPPTEASRLLQALELERKRRGLPQPAAVSREALANELARRGIWQRKYASYEEFIRRANPTLWNYDHVRWIAPVVDDLVNGKITNLLVMAPPRYFKTEVFGRLLVPYFLDAHPLAPIALLTHSDSLALDELSEPARTNYLEHVGALRPDIEAKSRWETQYGGVVWASGLGGQFQGKGLRLGVLDDPVDVEQSRSSAHQERFVRFWPQRFLNRRNPGAQIVLTMQRIGPDDPIDFLFRREVGERTEKAPMNWHVLLLDEVKSDEPLGRWSGERGLPPTCTLIKVDPRKAGDVLAPQLFSAEAVEKARTEAGPFTTATQRQQRPLLPTGDYWQAAWFKDRTYENLPDDAYNGGWDWDTALTADERNSATAGVKSYRGPKQKDGTFNIYVDDVDFRWVEFPALVTWIQGTPGPHHIEAKASGKSAAQSLKAYGVVVTEVPVTGDKLARANKVQPAVSAGRIHVSQKVVQKLLWADRQGLLRITAEQLQQGGEGLDLNDAFVQAIHRHLGINAEPRLRARVV